MTNYKAILDEGKLLLGKKRVVLHCNHYNIFLQQTLLDSLDKEAAIKIQKNASKKISLEMLIEYFIANATEDKLRTAIEIFSSMGLGKLNFDKVQDGKGIVELEYSHYGISYFEKYGPAKEGICYFAAGYIMAILSLIHNNDVDYTRVKETQCIAQDPDFHMHCIFEVN